MDKRSFPTLSHRSSNLLGRWQENCSAAFQICRVIFLKRDLTDSVLTSGHKYNRLRGIPNAARFCCVERSVISKLNAFRIARRWVAVDRGWRHSHGPLLALWFSQSVTKSAAII